MKESEAARSENEMREEDLRKLSRTLRALSDSRRAMIRATDEGKYVQEVCDIVIRDCGHRMAWVGYAREDTGRTVEPVAWAGAEDGYLKVAKITWRNTERGRGPTGTSIRTGKVTVCNSFSTDPRAFPWRKEAIRRGYVSCIALPILAESAPLGALTIYSDLAMPFLAEEVPLLTELCEDLAYGITTLRLRHAHAAAASALKISEEKFAKAFANNPAAISLTRLNDGTFLDVNETWTAINGYSREEIIGRSASEMRIWPTADARDCFVRELRDKGVLRDWEQEFFNKAGGSFYAQLSAGVLYIQGEAVVLSTLLDITDRKQAEAALRESRAKLAAALASMTDAVFISDAKGRFVDFNDAFVTFHRFRSKTECLRTLDEYHTILDMFMADGTPAPGEMWAVPRALRGEKATSVEYTLRRKDTGETWAGSYSFGPIANEKGSIVGAVVAARDITEGKWYRDRLQSMSLEVSLAEERERRCLAVGLHDSVSQLLTAAQMRLSLFQSAKSEVTRRELLAQVEQLVGRAERSVRSLTLQLSPPALYELGFAAAAEWLVGDMKAVYGLKIDLIEDGEIDVRPMDISIRVILFQCLRELLVNVSRHARTDRAVVRMRAAAKSVRLTVADRGIGFNVAAVDRRHSSGGFGLFSIRERIRHLRGRVLIRSTPRRGAIVQLMVPSELPNTLKAKEAP